MDTFRSVMSSVKDIDLLDAAQFRLKEDDIAKIWHEISLYIDQLMIQSKGVLIPGLGTFTFYQQKIQVSHQDYVLIQRPIFVIAEKFAATHQIKYIKVPVEGKIPVQHINYTYLHKHTGYSRDHLQLVVKHVVQTFSRDLFANQVAECVFDGIGKLKIKNQNVEMRFSKEFIEDLDTARKALLTPRAYIEESFKSLSTCKPKKYQEETKANENNSLTKLDLNGLESGSDMEFKSSRLGCNETARKSCALKEESTVRTDRSINNSTRWKCTENRSECTVESPGRKPLNKVDTKIVSRLSKPISRTSSKAETEMKHKNLASLAVSRGMCLLDRLEEHDQKLSCTHRSVTG